MSKTDRDFYRDQQNMLDRIAQLEQSLIQAQVPLVSVLPKQPFHGQRVDFQNAFMELHGWVWNLRARLFNIDGTPNTNAAKWEFEGGSPLRFYNQSGVNTSTTSYTALAGSGLTLPLLGDYDIAWGGRLYTANPAGASAYLGLLYSGTEASRIDSWQGSAGSAITLHATSQWSEYQSLNAVAGAIWSLGLATSAAGPSVNVERFGLRVTPVRVG